MIDETNDEIEIPGELNDAPETDKPKKGRRARVRLWKDQPAKEYEPNGMDPIMELYERIDRKEQDLNERRRELEDKIAKELRDLAKARESLANQGTEQMLKFLEAQRQADRDLALERERIRVAAETSRAQTEPRGHQGQDELWKMRLELLDQRHGIEIEGMKAKFEAELAKIRQETERHKSGIPIPDDDEFYRWYWKKKIEDDLPDKSWIEQVVENLEPIASFLQEHPALLQAVFSRGTIARRETTPAPVALPAAGSPPAHNEPEPSPAIDLDDDEGANLL
jgi:hypothetical protein